MQKPPTYVSHIAGGKVHLRGPLQAIRGKGIRTRWSSVGRRHIPYAENEAGLFESVDLFVLLNQLVDIGVAFSAGRAWCPREIMEEAQARGLIQGPFTCISWSAPGEWHLEKVEVDSA